MRSLKKLIVGSLVVLASTAQAQIIDFVYLTEGTDQLGESAWSTLSLSYTEFDVDIKGSNGSTVYAYLDWNHAGLGVCGNVDNTGAHPNSKDNVCNPSSDDNVTTGEALHFVFSENVTITKIWFNNTHDEDRMITPSDSIFINGNPVTGPLGNGYAPTSNQYNTDDNHMSSVGHFLGPYSVDGGDMFTIAFGDQQFYISGMEVSVPEPGTLALLGSGLLGIGLFRRRRQG